MHSSPDDQEDDLFPSNDGASTPKLAQAPSELSPPTPQHGPPSNNETIAPSSATATASNISAPLSYPVANPSALNENGKRILRSEAGARTHPWDRDEEGPGWVWRNKKAQEESARSWDNIVDKDRMIKASYGDVLAPRAGT